jgi:hypothetical protein
MGLVRSPHRHEVSADGSTPVFMWLVITILTSFYYYNHYKYITTFQRSYIFQQLTNEYYPSISISANMSISMATCFLQNRNSRLCCHGNCQPFGKSWLRVSHLGYQLPFYNDFVVFLNLTKQIYILNRPRSLPSTSFSIKHSQSPYKRTTKLVIKLRFVIQLEVTIWRRCFLTVLRLPQLK